MEGCWCKGTGQTRTVLGYKYTVFLTKDAMWCSFYARSSPSFYLCTMKSLLLLPLRLVAFWLLFFAVFRLWFVLWFYRDWSPETPMRVWASFWYALPLDLSMAGYLVLAPVVFWFIGMAMGARVQGFMEQVILAYKVLIFSVLIFIFGANVFIYEEWHTLLNNRALEYFKAPAALMDSMSLPFKVVCVLLYVGFTWVVYRTYMLIVGRKIYRETTGGWWVFLALPVWLAVLLLAIRGGLGVMPINESAVYYSAHIFDNHAATNTAWHLAHSKMETRSTENLHRVMPATEANIAVSHLLGTDKPMETGSLDFFSSTDTTPLNLVFIIMESHTAQVVEALGGVQGVCPSINQLIEEGVLFTNCYGSGYRTDQGIVSVLAGYPAQPDQSIVLLEDKATKLRTVSGVLHERGYATAFFYGGELTFANIGSWLTNQHFERIVSEKDFTSAEHTQRWGVDDQLLLQRAALEINQLHQPFFATAMTPSLHPPYDVPYQSQWHSNTDRDKFLNSAAFADHALGVFFKTAAQQPWYKNTLFVLVADHGSSQPGGIGLDNPGSRHIPLIFFGAPFRQQWRGKRLDMYCNHHDIPSTVLPMLGIKPAAGDFPWSRNQWQWDAMNKAKPRESTDQRPHGFAFFTNENGIGWATEAGKGFYYFGEKTWHQWEGKLDTVSQRDAQAYLQTLYDDFLAK